MTEKSYKQIVLHAGMPKTGTSTIQSNCHKYRDWLHQHGIVYPNFKFQNRSFFNHSDPLAAVFGTQVGRYGMPQRLGIEGSRSIAIAAFSEQLQQILDNPAGTTLLLSAEIICDLSAQDMLALRSHLEGHTETLQVVALIRSPQSSLESIIQQRCRSGHVVDPASLAGVVMKRYEALQHTFSDILSIINYHDAMEHPLGLMGWFFCYLGLAQDEFLHFEFVNSNKRISMEAYTLIEAINRAYPKNNSGDHGVERNYNDLGPLYSLPGQPFHIEGRESAKLFEALVEEGAWLELKLNIRFPELAHCRTTPLWQEETLMALESAINLMDHRLLRDVAKRTLIDQSASLETLDPGTAAVLKFIAQRVNVSEEPSTELILEKLGADYFKFSALQVEQGSTDMALLLMMLARILRPKYAPFINDRIQYYREHLSAPESSETLKFIGRAGNVLKSRTTDVILEALGADYFIFSAQLVEHESPEMALLLMLLAGQLRPDAPFINERILHYEEKMGKTTMVTNK